MKQQITTKENTVEERDCISRRKFLFLSGTGIAGAVMVGFIPSGVQGFSLKVVSYPRKKIGSLSALKADRPEFFNYPDDGPNTLAIVVKLGKKAGMGVGPESDVVAFSAACPHMGGPVGQTYKAEYKALGPCPLHLTTFDLRKHGMVVTGHSVESLPQIKLELDGDKIYAVGVMGLIYGYPDNTINIKKIKNDNTQ